MAELSRGGLFHITGDRQHSDTRFRNALGVMQQIESDSRERAGLVLAEQYRTYRGQPYERATAFFYRGLCHYELGHYEQALAAFRSALAEDQETNNGDPVKRRDYLAAYYMQAQCLKALGECPEADAVLAAARELAPRHPLFASDQPKGNVLVVAGVGVGPWMVQGAFWTVSFLAGKTPSGNLTASTADGTSARLLETTDLLLQADSNKAGGATKVAVGRAVAKEVVNAGLSVLAGRDAGLHEKRDLRCWNGVPRKFYIGWLDLPPGLHTVTFAFSETGEKGSDAARYQQTWHDVPVRDSTAHQLLYVRLLPNAQNFHDLVPVALDDALAVKREKEAK